MSSYRPWGDAPVKPWERGERDVHYIPRHATWRTDSAAAQAATTLARALVIVDDGALYDWLAA